MLNRYSHNRPINRIRITKIITNKSINSRKYVPFEEIKMFGTLLKYKGYNVETVCTDNTCVPTYLLNLLNNPDETDKNRKITKLTMENIIKDLNMNNIDEGCCLEQLMDFCRLYKVIN